MNITATRGRPIRTLAHVHAKNQKITVDGVTLNFVEHRLLDFSFWLRGVIFYKFAPALSLHPFLP